MGRGRRSTALAFVLCLGAFEAASRTVVAELSYRGGPRPLYELAEALERWPTRPTAVFLGASHTQCAIVPDALAAALGVPQAAVVNAGRNNGGVRESLFLYRRARRVLAQARVVVVDVSDRDFNRNLAVVERKGPAAWRRRAGLRERLRIGVDRRTRTDWLAGWLFATWDLRATWRDLVGLAATGLARRAGLVEASALFEGDGRALVPPERAMMTPRRLEDDAAAAAQRHMQDYAPDDEAFGDLARLVRAVEGDGPEVILIEYPVSAAYRRIIARRFREADALWRSALASRLPGEPLWSFETEAFVPHDFRDADHLSREGAVRFSRSLGVRLRRTFGGPAPSAGVAPP